MFRSSEGAGEEEDWEERVEIDEAEAKSGKRQPDRPIAREISEEEWRRIQEDLELEEEDRRRAEQKRQAQWEETEEDEPEQEYQQRGRSVTPLEEPEWEEVQEESWWQSAE